MSIIVLVTGANGQLAKCIQHISHTLPSLDFFFVDKKILDISNTNDVLEFFKTHTIDWCINCAAYTAVDKAENDRENAYKVNAFGAKNLAQACQEYGVKMFHISTDFVFDGLKNTPYTELDDTNPLNVYGESKLKGENEIKQILEKHFIIRTSWLYSEYGNNFMKTMLRFAKEKHEINIINDQFGTPTYAGDLAQTICNIIHDDSENYGTYHYSNDGAISWFDFAKAIFDFNNVEIKINPIPTSSYPTPAKRPMYSVLNKSKIVNTLGIKIPFWKKSLQNAILKLNN